MTANTQKNKRRTLLLAFAISGMTALIYEIAWIRDLQLVFGSTVYAVSTLLTTFMAGYALGSYLFRNVADKTKKPTKLFAYLQLGIGVYGLIMIFFLLNKLPNVYTLNLPGAKSLQIVLGFLMVLVPATLFGATWPVINKANVKIDRIGRDAGKLYSFNSLGSVFGSLGAGFLLIPLLGITKTSLLASVLNIVVALTLFWRKDEK